MEKEKVYLTEEELEDFDFTGRHGTWKLRGETYTYVDDIDTSRYSDGESWDTLVKRESDGKFFKWNCWDGGYSNGYIMQHGDNYMVEAIPTKIITTKWD